MNRWGWLVAWLAWIALYVVLSSRLGSSENSSEWIRGLIRALSPALAERLTPEVLSAINYVVRKGAHFCGFAFLTYLAYQMLHRSFGLDTVPALRWAVITSIVRAMLDEFQQMHVPGRTASVVDAGIDTAGILLMAYWISVRLRHTRLLKP